MLRTTGWLIDGQTRIIPEQLQRIDRIDALAAIRVPPDYRKSTSCQLEEGDAETEPNHPDHAICGDRCVPGNLAGR